MTSRSDSYAALYVSGPNAPWVREHRLGGTDPVHMLMVEQPAGDYSDRPVPELILCETRASGFRARCDFGAGPFTARSNPGDLHLVAPETARDIVVDDPHRLRIYGFPVAALRPLLTEARTGDPFDFGRLHAGGFRNPLIATLCGTMWDEAEHGGLAGRLFVDGAVLAIVSALLREAAQPRPATPEQGLAEWRLARCLDYIEANLGCDIGMDELASAAGLSPVYFARQFKRSTGAAPYRYLIGRRVARAKDLLRRDALPLIDVALACGFCDAGHMTRLFKRATGSTPAAYRRAHRS